MNRQYVLKFFLLACVISWIVFSGVYVTWASPAKIISQSGEVSIQPTRSVGDDGFIPLNSGDKVTVKSGLAVIEYESITRQCKEGNMYGAVIVPAGKTHTVKYALDASCTPTNKKNMSNAFVQAKKGREQKVTLYNAGKAGDPRGLDNTDIFESNLRNSGLRRR